MATKSEIDPRVFHTQPVIKKSADHKSVYSNMVRTAVTPFDIRMVFGQVSEPIPGDPAQQGEEFVTVIMAPEEAKAIIPLIQQALQVYEAQYGEIRDVTARLEKMKAEAAAMLAKAQTPAKSETPPKAETPRKPKKH